MDKFFKKVCIFLSVLVVVSSFFALGTAVKSYNNPSAPDLFSSNDIVNNIRNLELNMTSVIYVQNKDGEWVEYQRIHGNENRIWVSLDKMPKHLIDAFVAIEDQRFFSHTGVDWKRTGAAFINWLPKVNILSGNQGGSTLTQQLIKNITSDNDQSASRKFREIFRALSIEKILDKNTILEAYLNTISLGNGICGVQVAANNYFNKDVSDLTLEECASLAAITKNPSAYNPISFPEKNDERRKLVLDEMYRQDKITDAEYCDAIDKKVVIDNTQKNKFEIDINNYFVDTLIEDVIKDLSEKYNCSTDTASSMLYNGGYKIYSTLDPSIQETMESVYQNVPAYFSQKRDGENVQSAMTVMDYSGHIVGIVGGAGEKTVNRGLNRATSAPRQPGSTMKPLGVYAPALDNGVIYYSTVVEDKPLEIYYKDGKPGPKEWYGYYAGNMSISKAIERSANTIPCHILKDLGLEKSYKFLTENLGLKHLVEEDKNIAALALGGCSYGITTTESAAAYAVFGNNGIYYEPTTYYKIEKVNGDIVLNADTKGKRALKKDTANIMNKLLQGVVYGSQGTGRGISYYNSMKAYAKTGTSSESNDLWMVAGTPYYIGSVWYGFDHNGTIYNQGAAATVWRTIMSKVHEGLEKKEFEDVNKLTATKYCMNSGKLAADRCYSCEYGCFVDGLLPPYCDGKHIYWNINSQSSEEESSDDSSADSSDSAESKKDKPSDDTSKKENTSSKDVSSKDSKPSKDDNNSSKDVTSNNSSKSSQSDNSSSKTEKTGSESKPEKDDNSSTESSSSSEDNTSSATSNPDSSKENLDDASKKKPPSENPDANKKIKTE